MRKTSFLITLLSLSLSAVLVIAEKKAEKRKELLKTVRSSGSFEESLPLRTYRWAHRSQQEASTCAL